MGYTQDLVNVVLSMKQITKNFDLKLLIVGDGDLRHSLEQLV